MNTFPKRWEGLIVRVWQRYYGGKRELYGEKEDLLQAGRLACLLAWPAYDRRKGRITTYLWHKIRTAMDAAAEQPMLRHRCLSLEALMEAETADADGSAEWQPPDPRPGPEQIVLHRAFCEATLRRMDRLCDPRFRRIVTLLLIGESQTAIAVRLGVHETRLCQILKASRKLLKGDPWDAP